MSKEKVFINTAPYSEIKYDIDISIQGMDKCANLQNVDVINRNQHRLQRDSRLLETFSDLHSKLKTIRGNQ